MSRRLIGLRQLAWSLDDLSPAVKGSRTGAGDRGEFASVWRECGACGGEGERPDRFGRLRFCEGCGGRGGFRVDPYTEQASVVAWQSGPPSRRVLCDACGGSGRRGAHGLTCGRCGGSGGFSVPLVAADEDPLEREPGVRLEAALERRARAGSYTELERALLSLFARDRRGWRGFMRGRVFVRAEDEPSDGVWDVEPASGAEVFLLSKMPSRVRVPADVRHAWEHRHVFRRQAEQARAKGRHGSRLHRDRRDRQIRELYDRGRGLSSDVLAERFGISARQVRNIVRG